MQKMRVPLKVAQTMVDSRQGLVLVSTVFLPMQSREYYETLVFPATYDADGEIQVTDWVEIDASHDYTRTQAIESHFDIVRKWSAQWTS
jgi:hypothetical protein